MTALLIEFYCIVRFSDKQVIRKFPKRREIEKSVPVKFNNKTGFKDI